MCYKTMRCADYKHLGAQLSSRFQRGLWLVIIASMPSLTYAQKSLSAAIGLALRNSPRVKMAEDDAKRAAISLSELKNVFIPRTHLINISVRDFCETGVAQGVSADWDSRPLGTDRRTVGIGGADPVPSAA